jgi:hypothetical protein
VQLGHVHPGGVPQVETRVVGVDGAHEIEIGIGLDRLAHRPPHAAGGAEHSDTHRHIRCMLRGKESIW